MLPIELLNDRTPEFPIVRVFPLGVTLIPLPAEIPIPPVKEFIPITP